MRKSYSETLCSGRDSLWTPGSVRLSSEHGYARVRASIFIYIFIYTSVNPYITCTKRSRAEQQLLPITDEQESALFERPFRTQTTNAPHGCGLELHFSSMLRLRGRLERHPSSILRLLRRFDRHFSSILWLRGELEPPFRAICGSRVSSSSHFEPSAAPGQAPAAICSK